MTLTVAVAGVPTPLLALHWYCIMSSIASCLLTFTTSNNEVFESTTPLPCLVHVMVGSGLPRTLHAKVVLWPSTTITSCLRIVTEGGSTTQIKKFKLQQKHNNYNNEPKIIITIQGSTKNDMPLSSFDITYKNLNIRKNQLTMDRNLSNSFLLFTNSVPSCTCVIPCCISGYVYNAVNIPLM